MRSDEMLFREGHLVDVSFEPEYDPISGLWKCHTLIEKFEDGADKPYDVAEHWGNLCVTLGANFLFDALSGFAITAFSNANAAIGVADGGGSVPTPANADTNLTGATNRLRKGMQAGYPKTKNTNSGTDRQYQAQSQFASAEANWQWREWGVFNSSTASDATSMLNHVGVDMGLKSSGQTWTITVTCAL